MLTAVTAATATANAAASVVAAAALPPSSPAAPRLEHPAAGDVGAQVAWQPTRSRQRQAVVGGIVAAHVLALWGLLQVRSVRDAVSDLMPVTVSVIDAPTPQAPEPPPPITPPRPQRPAMDLPIPVVSVVVAAPAPTPAPSPITVEVAPPVVSPGPPAPPAPAPAPVAAGPRELPSSAVQVIFSPSPEYPRASRRERETGVVHVRLFIDAAGLPRQVQLARGSGFARLDEAALAAIRKWRFRPPLESGRPIEGWFTLPLTFDLD